MRILITAGGTREPIDGVRFITNFSSGNTGAFICDFLRSKGHEVHFIHAKDSKMPTQPGHAKEFTSFSSLEDVLRSELKANRFDAVLHLAAISDFSVDKIQIGDRFVEPSDKIKLNSEQPISLHLKVNTKLINQLKDFTDHKEFTLIGFKLTNTKSDPERQAAVDKLGDDYNIDYIVHNDLSEIDSAGKRHIARIFHHDKLIATTQTKTGLAETIESILKERL